MNNNIKVITSNGLEKEVEVLDIFTVAGYEDKEYILYTENKELDNNNIEVLVSILRKKDGIFNLDNIEDNLEWEAVQKAIDEMGDLR